MTMTFGLTEKLRAGQPVTIQALGDSTVYGAFDTAMGGWVGRLGVAFGKDFNATVGYQQWNGSGVYGTATTLNTGTKTNQVLVRNAGVPGWTTANVYYQLNTMLNIPNPDVIIHGTGFNDVNVSTTPAGFVANIRLLIAGIKSRCPNVPIIITTENVASTSSYNAAFNALTNDLVGQSLPVSPPLLASTTISDVWLMDTRQAYGNTWQSSLMTDSLHPNAAGYQAQADWMYGQIYDPKPQITTTTLKDMVRNELFYQALKATPSGVTWSVSKGTLPEGLLLNGTSGEIGGKPTSYDGKYSFTVRATNTSDLYDEVNFSGTIDRNVIPFDPTNTGKVNYRALGVFYSASAKIKSDSGFVPLVIRS